METLDLKSMTQKQKIQHKQQLMRDAMALRLRLFHIANKFAGDETGHVAVKLHQSCNEILFAKEHFEDYCERIKT